MSAHYIPKNHRSIAPYFVVKNMRAFIDFLASAFRAEVLKKIELPNGRIQHCEIMIGDSIVMAGQRDEPMQLATHYYLADVDEAYQRCLKAGGKSLYAPITHPYGDRGAGIADPEGNIWWISTHLEEISEDEYNRRVSPR